MRSPLRPLLCALLIAFAGLAGCSLLSNDSDERHPGRAGFSVRVDGPGLPSTAVVVRDIGTFAQSHGFVRDSASPAALDRTGHTGDTRLLGVGVGRVRFRATPPEASP